MAVVPENSHPWGQDRELYETKASGTDLQREIEGLSDRSKGSRSSPGRRSSSTCRL
jgi:hypothetical protein